MMFTAQKIDCTRYVFDIPGKFSVPLSISIAKGKELQHEFVLEQAKIAASNNHQTLETAIKQLAHIEASIQTYVLIKRVMNPTAYRLGQTSIQVPTNNSSYRTVIDPEEIKGHLINRNMEHYTQAENTPMAHHLSKRKWEHLGQQISVIKSSKVQQIYQIFQIHFNQYSGNYTDHTL
jgi:hypothetical protein